MVEKKSASAPASPPTSRAPTPESVASETYSPSASDAQANAIRCLNSIIDACVVTADPKKTYFAQRAAIEAAAALFRIRTPLIKAAANETKPNEGNKAALELLASIRGGRYGV
jgi:hypothetical protein